MERKDICESLKWKLTDIFPSDEEWEKEFKAIEAEYVDYDFSAYKGNLGDKKTLLACFGLSDVISRRIEKVYLYAHLNHDVDVRDSQFTSAQRISTLQRQPKTAEKI